VKWIARKSEFRKDPVRLPLLLFRVFLRLLAACQSVPRAECPIVIVHLIGLDAIPAFAVRRITGCKIILYAVGPDVLGEMKLGQKSLLRWAVRNADAVLCGNGKIEEVVRSLGGRVTKVLPTPFFPLELGVEMKKEFDVVTVGGLTGAAKQSLLVEASAYLDPSVKIAIVGEGPQRHNLTKLSRGHGRNQVTFLGDLPPKRVYQTLLSSSLYVQCSPDEGPTSSVLEAVSCGLPIIALNGDRNPELTETYGLRAIVPKDREAFSLATAIEGAMQNYPTLLEDVSKNREALESYSRSWPSMAMEAIFA
ncbi:MAG: glycosyltransferase, partial [Thaumarchaeota archaeon]|nr:glycosyltransferase [Nitrososphaerota archaeon]